MLMEAEAAERARRAAGLPQLDPLSPAPEPVKPVAKTKVPDKKPAPKPPAKAPVAKAVKPPEYDPDAKLTRAEWLANFKAREAMRRKPLVRSDAYDVDALFPPTAEVIDFPAEEVPDAPATVMTMDELLRATQ